MSKSQDNAFVNFCSHTIWDSECYFEVIVVNTGLYCCFLLCSHCLQPWLDD
jgi:hypothetical protein